MSFRRTVAPAAMLIAVALVVSVLARPASAKQCGGAIACECGDAVVASTTLANDLGPCTGTGLRVIGSGIVVDCARHLITGNDTSNAKFGIELDQVIGTEVRNCRVTGFRRGLRINGGSQNVLSRNRSFANKYGIDLAGGTVGNRVERNLVRDNRDEGIHVGGSHDNVIFRNEIRYNKRENLYLLRSHGNKVQRNYLHHGQQGAALYVKHSSDNRFIRNDVRDAALGVVGDSHGNVFNGNYLKNSGYNFTAYCTREDGTTCPEGEEQPIGEAWTWTHPHGNTMADDCIRKTHECYRFSGAYENSASGARLDGTHPCEDLVIAEEMGGQEATDNVVEVSEDTCNSDQF